MAGMDETVENEVIVLINRLPEPFMMSQHHDPLVCLLWVEDIPAFDILRDAAQPGEIRSRFLRCTVNHLVDGRFGKACCLSVLVLAKVLGAWEVFR